ncbi:MAG: hypothetical protein ACI89J_003804, partial [Hyphomicrobiaceae bacterium]
SWPGYEVEQAFAPPSRISLKTERAMKSAERRGSM